MYNVLLEDQVAIKLQKTQQYAQKRLRARNATPHGPNRVSYSEVGIALCESTVVREYRC